MPDSRSSLPSAMTAWVIDEFGGPEVFERRQIDTPEVGAGEVLVDVRATSVNPVDYKIRRGDAAGLCPPRPATLHGDVAGIIVAVGKDVTAFDEGDAVYGCAGGFVGAPHGALADFMPCDARLLAPMPEALSFREAACLPLVTLTAWEALVDKSNVQAGEQVLVHGATGGVGHAGVQLAAMRNCEVTTTASSRRKLELGEELGADHLVNYEEESVDSYVGRLTDDAGFDMVFDTVAGENYHRSVEAARIDGAVATVNPQVNLDLRPAYNKALTLHLVLMLTPIVQGVGRAHHGEILREATTLVEKGHLRPLVDDRPFTFDEIGEAHAYAEAGEQIGKVAVTHPAA